MNNRNFERTQSCLRFGFFSYLFTPIFVPKMLIDVSGFSNGAGADTLAYIEVVSMADYTFVLIHGGWHGGWCFKRVARLLRARGHEVFTPTLTGLGERSHLSSGGINLSTHITDVVNVLRWEDLEKVVLCGHSYGGVVITGVAEQVPGLISSIVYLDAFIAKDGRSVLDMLPPAASAAVLSSVASRGGLAVPAISAAEFNVNAADRAWVDGKCTAQPLASSLEAIRVTGAYQRIKSKTFIRAARYSSPDIDAHYEVCAADPSWNVRRMDCGHDLMIDMPETLADLLEEAAHR